MKPVTFNNSNCANLAVGHLRFDNGLLTVTTEEDVELVKKSLDFQYGFIDVVASEENKTTPEMTKAQVVEELKKLEVEFDPKANKDDLVALLASTKAGQSSGDQTNA